MATPQPVLKGPLFLSGFMGSGKTSVGRLLAQRLECPFIDLDALIERTFGMSVPEIFRRHGEAGFRQAEAKLLSDCGQRPSVVALGGGAVLDPRSRQFIRERGLLVYLRTRPESLVGRLEAERSKRPLIDTAEGLEKRVLELLSERGPVYEEAPIVVDTDDLSVEEVADLLIKRLQERS